MIVELTQEEEEALREVTQAPWDDEEKDKDMVDAPTHYQSESGIQCWDAQLAAVGKDGFVSHCRATAIKYLWRTGKKDPAAEIDDLRKAVRYLEKAIEVLDK